MKSRYIIVAVLIAFAGVYWLGGRKSRQEANRLAHALSIAKSDKLNLVDIYEIEIAGLKKTVHEKEQILLTKTEAIKAGYLEKERYRKLYLKSISNTAQLEINIEVLSDSLDQLQTIINTPDPVTGEPVPSLPLPWEFDKSDPDLVFTGGITDKGRFYYLIGQNIDLDLTIGMQKRTQKPVISVLTTNQHINSININSVSVTHQKRFYDTFWFQFGAGFATGAATNYFLSR